MALMERVTGVEPVSSAWRADILAIILHPQIQVTTIISNHLRGDRNLKKGNRKFFTFYNYYNKNF